MGHSKLKLSGKGQGKLKLSGNGNEVSPWSEDQLLSGRVQTVGRTELEAGFNLSRIWYQNTP